MNSIAHLIPVIAVPLYVLLIALEILVDKARGTEFYRLNDSISSMSIGLISGTHQLLLFAFSAYIIAEFIPIFKPFDWSQYLILTWAVAFIAFDLTYYWAHRYSHEINLLWAAHVVHHQSEDYNLSTALRQTSTGFFTWIFSIPLYMIGLPVETVVACAGLNLIYQFWIHTQHIKTLGWVEKVMVTPSHHRVHHAQNEYYWDKNYSGVFIIWDKLFGTFRQESIKVPLVYGVSRPLKSNNPLTANFQVWWSMLQDAYHCKSVWDKCRIWFMPTGWRPEGMAECYPIAKTDMDTFKKYDPQVNTSIKHYVLLQFVLSTMFGGYFIFMFNELSFVVKLMLWLLITLPVVTGGMLLDGANKKCDFVRLLVSLGLLLGVSQTIPQLAWVTLSVYIALNTAVLFWLPKKNDVINPHE